MRVRMKPASTRSRTTTPATTHHKPELPAAALAGVEVADVGVAGVEVAAAELGVGVGAAEVVGVVGAAVVGAVVRCAGDGEVAVKEYLPLTGCPSAEVARHRTVYRPAGEPGRRLWMTVLSAKAALPV